VRLVGQNRASGKNIHATGFMEKITRTAPPGPSFDKDLETKGCCVVCSADVS